MKRSLQDKLTEMYRSVPPEPNPEGVNFIIEEAKHIREIIPRESSMFWFVKNQIRFVDIKVWLSQMLLICVYACFAYFSLPDIEGFLLLVPIAPIVIFIGMSELSSSFRYRMAEMEMPTRFSLRQVLLARLIIIVATDLLVLTSLLFITALQTYMAVSALVLYGMVPCLVAAYGCLWILNRYNHAHSQYYTAAYCIALSVIGALSVNLWPMWYDASAQGIWVFVFLITLAGLFAEGCKMFRNFTWKLEFYNK